MADEANEQTRSYIQNQFVDCRAKRDGGRIREHDWSGTPLGPLEEWSDTLLATANLMLHSPFPTILAWGPDMVFLYNDAAISTLTIKHPGALGGIYREVFNEAWELVGAIWKRVITGARRRCETTCSSQFSSTGCWKTTISATP